MSMSPRASKGSDSAMSVSFVSSHFAIGIRPKVKCSHYMDYPLPLGTGVGELA